LKIGFIYFDLGTRSFEKGYW